MSDPRTTRRSNPWAAGVALVATSLLLMTGFFQLFQGIAGIASDDVLVKAPNYTYELDTTAWGWIHLVVGALFIVIALSMFTGNAWARGAGIGIAVVSAVANFLWLPYYPLWAITLIAIDVVIIWALATFEPLD